MNSLYHACTHHNTENAFTGKFRYGYQIAWVTIIRASMATLTLTLAHTLTINPTLRPTQG